VLHDREFAPGQVIVQLPYGGNLKVNRAHLNGFYRKATNAEASLELSFLVFLRQYSLN
jgi:hypothetical protein